jgi:hypothetical protein
MAGIIVAFSLRAVIGWSRIVDLFRPLEVYMNEAFYGAVCLGVGTIWFLAIWLMPRLQYYTVTQGRLSEHGPFRRRDPLPKVMISRLEDDLIRRWVLGLGPLFRICDLVAQPTESHTGGIILENVVGLTEGDFDNIAMLLRTQRTARGDAPTVEADQQ